MDIRFDDHVVLITGASSGIGKYTAIEFCHSGATVVVNYHKSESDAEMLVADLISAGGKAMAVKADVTRLDEVRAMAAAIGKTFGRVDILVNNAGALIQRAPVSDISDELVEKVISLNLKSVFTVTREILPLIKKTGSGKIINVASIAGRVGGTVGAAHYAAAKGAVITLTKNMAKELAPFGILVNAVAPGVITTRFHEGVTSDEIRKKFTEQIPLRREGRAEEVAWPILFLASGFASYITGETLEVNGGQLMD
jgi:3-oxoacyl-[acyl-carrier protein] reductase